MFKIEELGKVIEVRKEQSYKVLDEISEIEKQIGQIEKNKQLIINVIERRISMTESYKEFIELVERKNEFWKKKLEINLINIENTEFYAIFFSAYLSYAAPLNRITFCFIFR